MEASNHHTGQDTEETNDFTLPFFPSCRERSTFRARPGISTKISSKGNQHSSFDCHFATLIIMSKEVAVVKKGSEEDEYTIKPQATTPALDTSSWPLLLKNYDKRESSS